MGVLIEKEPLHVLRDYITLISVSTTMYSTHTCTPQLFTHSHTHTHTHHLTETDTWSKHTTSGPPPQTLSMSGIISDDKLVTFGGVLSGKGCNSVNILDISESPYSRIVKNQSEREREYGRRQDCMYNVEL